MKVLNAPLAMTITSNHVAALVKAEGKLQSAPHNETMHELGFSNDQLRKIQLRIAKCFNKTVSTIFFQDTIYTITDRLNGNHN